MRWNIRFFLSIFTLSPAILGNCGGTFSVTRTGFSKTMKAKQIKKEKKKKTPLGESPFPDAHCPTNCSASPRESREQANR